MHNALRTETSMGVYRSDKEAVPSSWEPTFLATCMHTFKEIEARMSGPRGPKEFGTNWPGYTHSKTDINGYINRDFEPELVLQLRRNSRADPFREHLESFKYTRVSLSTIEASFFEGMLDRLRGFGAINPVARALLEKDAKLVVDGASQQERCIAAARPLGTFKDMRRRALNAFCIYLNENNWDVLKKP